MANSLTDIKMFDEPEYSNTVTFTNAQHTQAGWSNIQRKLDDGDCYTDIVDEFLWFIQSMGFTYISGISVHNDEGKEIYRTLT